MDNYLFFRVMTLPDSLQQARSSVIMLERQRNPPFSTCLYGRQAASDLPTDNLRLSNEYHEYTWNLQLYLNLRRRLSPWHQIRPTRPQYW